MTHQTLISSAPAFSSAPHLLHASSSSSFPFPRSRSSVAAFVMSSSPFSHHHGSLEEREGSMSALRSSLRPHEAAEEVTVAMVAGPAAWGAGDGFLVDDLLDLEELCEVEKEGCLLCEAVPPAEEEEEEEEQKCSDSHGSSVVSYELMPLLPPEMDLPAHDAEELEWVSRIMDDSLAELPPPPRLPAAPSAVWRPKEAAAYPMRTPTICALSTEALVPVRSKKRSKRSRATTVWSLSGASVSDSASSSTTTTSSTSSSASLSSFFLLDSPTFNPLDEPPRSRKSKRGKPKKRGRKPKQHFPPQLSASPPVQGDRRCSHCGVQKTPQWRAGPEGAKTLCNACGVRFKSGRLLPEYRPACSPTFVGDLHSNSHRKVLEMRRKKDPVTEAVLAAPTVASF